MWEMQTPEDGIYRCSFCGQPQREGSRFTKGPGGACICEECVEASREIIEREQQLDLAQIRRILASRHKPENL